MRKDFHELSAFLAVARECSFTRAAKKLGTTQSALSHSVRKLESRLGVRLLTRTTRSVSPTEAGERLLDNIGPMFDDIEAEVAALSSFREKPAGMIRITVSQHASATVIQPMLARFLPNYPDIKIEVSIDNQLVDIVADRFDFGVRIGEQVASGMIAMRIGPDFRMIVVGSPSYFKDRKPPLTPQDLVSHNCINVRLPSYGALYPWEFEKDGREIKVRVEGQLIMNSGPRILDSAIAGLGLAWVPEDLAKPYLDDGRLIAVLDEWCVPFPGYHLYYPNRRHTSSAFTLFIEALRYRG
ncbi:LysR family transcriptional regulator [Pinirhizobacter soli]|uniref:LysR family transcriptional regulator n=1 Tax=Pinirhizobacter soli TaxID=2786953 RepID=UPI002029EE2F|nr:LysR family transcriptional regulator [Pinirhizobacter soli]